MKARYPKQLLCTPAPDRNAVIAEGLGLLGEYIARLDQDAEILYADKRRESAAIVDIYATEAAASFMILLDLVRAGWDRDQKIISEQVRRFSSHLARGIYANLYTGSPATIGEMEDYAKLLRQSHYLDGPSGVDWIFRNDIDAEREGALYVDYVQLEDGYQWETPMRQVGTHLLDGRMVERVVEVALALRNIGVCEVGALDVVAETWRKIDITDHELTWLTVREANQDIVSRIIDASADRTDLRAAVEWWIHPLNAIGMKEEEVKISNLQGLRQQWVEKESWS